MCFTFDVSFIDLWKYITSAEYWLVAIIALWFFLYMMNAATWKIILEGSGPAKVPYCKLLKWTITGFALNNVTPVGLAGGEPYKILELKEYVGTQRATSSVVLFAMMFIFAHFSYWTTAIVAYIVMWVLGYLPMNALTATLLFFMSFFCAAGIYLFSKGYKNGMVMKMFKVVSYIPGLKSWANQYATEHQADLKKIDLQISELHRQNKRSFWVSYILEYVGRILQTLEIVFIIFICTPELSLNTNNFMEKLSTSINLLPITFLNSFLILAFTSLFANLLFFLPLQLGGREGGFAMSTSQMGLTNQIGLFISILCRVRELFWTAVGLILMKIGNKK